MNNPIRTITLILTLNLLLTGFTLAQVEAVGDTPVVETAPSTVNVSPAAPPPGRFQQQNISSIEANPFNVLKEASEAATAAIESAKLQDMLNDLTIARSFVSNFVSNIDTVHVIPSQSISTEQLVEINEDLNIMSNILNNELNRSRIDTSEIEWRYSSGTWVPNNLSSYLGRLNNESSIMYLEGYGVLFSTKVDIPLVPPAGQEDQEQVPVEDNESLWQRTRGQLYGQSSSQSGTISGGNTSGGVGFNLPPTRSSSRTTTSTRSSEDRYDAQKVEDLKVAMLHALKQASNIRALKGDESVIISITGSKQSPSSDAMIKLEADAIVNIEKRSDGRTNVIYIENGATRTARYDDLDPNDIIITQTAPEVLVIRARKSDIDAFANGQSDMEQFRQNAQIISYPLLSESSVILTATHSTIESSSGQTSYTPPWESIPGSPLSSLRLSIPSTGSPPAPVRGEDESAAEYQARVRQYQQEVVRLRAEADTGSSSDENPTTPNRSNYGTQAEYQEALRQYQQELIRMREGQTTSTNPNSVQMHSTTSTQQTAESEED